MSEKILEIKDERLSFFTPAGEVKALNGVSFSMNQGDVLGIVGESGSGKSVTAYSIMGLTAYPGRLVGGTVWFNGHQIDKMTEKEFRKIRGNEVSIIFQDPMTSLNPVYTIGNQIVEVILLHTKKTKQEAWARARELLELVGINEPDRRLKQYPHELSGGMRQRVMIAIALACEPKLLIADEPTTALDVTIQAQYFSTSLGDFWRRWHISLGAWMRDYLFYPFALTKPMQRFGKWATSHCGKHFGRVLPAAVANLLVFAVVGIWHGPQAHYLAWGLYNGLVIALADLLEPAFKKLNTALHIPTESRGWHVFRIVRTFIIVNIGWYFDRNEFVQGCIYLRNTFTDFNLSALAANAPGAFAAVSGPAWGLVIISTLLVFAHSVLKEQGRDPYAEVQRLPLALRWGLYYLVIFMVLLSFICVNETVGFLYANF